MRSVHIRGILHGSIVTRKRIGINHLSFREKHSKTRIRLGSAHRVFKSIARHPDCKPSMVLPGDPYTVGRHGRGYIYGTVFQSDIGKIRQIGVLLILYAPVTIPIVRNMHAVITSVKQCLFYIFITGRWSAQKITPHSYILMSVRIMQIVICKSEAIMPRTQGPIPILLLKSAPAVKFHNLIARKKAHLLGTRASGTERMIHLYEIAVLSEQIKLKLLLEDEERKNVVKAVDLFASEDKFMVFEKIIAMLVHVDLILRIRSEFRNLVVIGKCNYVISKLLESIISLLWPILALVERPFNPWEEANTAIAAMLQEKAADTLDKVLFELSSQMKNAYSRSDA